MQTVIHSSLGGFGLMRDQKGDSRESGRSTQARDDLLKPREHSVEVTGLGIISILIVVSWPLVSDGTLRLSDYLVFVAFLLVSAGGLVWRLARLAPNQQASLRNKNFLTPNATSARER